MFYLSNSVLESRAADPARQYAAYDDKFQQGETSSDFEMKVPSYMGEGLSAWFLKEELANVIVNGNLDSDEFFKIRIKAKVYGRIHPQIGRQGRHHDTINLN